jgi:hypothetical protein
MAINDYWWLMMIIHDSQWIIVIIDFFLLMKNRLMKMEWYNYSPGFFFVIVLWHHVISLLEFHGECIGESSPNGCKFQVREVIYSGTINPPFPEATDSWQLKQTQESLQVKFPYGKGNTGKPDFRTNEFCLRNLDGQLSWNPKTW